MVLPFPFSDLTATKRRPALVLAVLPGEDIILCQITSRTLANTNAVSVRASDFADGGLRQDSNVRPDRLFTADSRLIAYRAGWLTAARVREVVARVIELLSD